MQRTAITIEIDISRLAHYSDSHLAALWHLAQVNPAPIEDQDAGELAERIGREIIRRWLQASPPELWRHQGHHHYWHELTKLGNWNTDGIFTPDGLAHGDKHDAPLSASGTGAAPESGSAS
jgi:hypothetical protein